MAEPFDVPLPTTGQKPWSLNPAIEEVRGRVGDVEDYVSGPGIQDAIAEAAASVEVVDGAVADLVSEPTSETFIELNNRFDRKRPLDPRDFGAVGDGTADDTAAIQATINAAGANGSVEFPGLLFKITSTLNILAGTELRGIGTKPTRITTAGDFTAIRAAGGQGQALRNLKVWSTFSGNRTTFDIEFASPTKPVIEDVEVDLNNNGGTGGGIRLYRDAGVTGNSFMPQLTRVWVRNGHIVINGVTDGKLTDCYVWAPATTGLGAIQCVNSASSWTFTDCDVVPPVGDYAGYYFHTVENIHVQGGLVDGSYAALLTGHGIRAINSYRISVRTSFWNLGRSALDLNNVRSSAFVGNVISRSNKADAGYPDINNVNGIGNTFIGNTHSCTVSRTVPGKIYQESGTSTDNVIDGNTRETGTNYYDSSPVSVQGSTYLGLGNRPVAAWPRQLSRNVTASETIPIETFYRGQSLFASGSITLTLPTAASFYVGTSIIVKNTGTGTVTITPNASETIEGIAASQRLLPSQSLTLMTSGSSSWRVVGGKGVEPEVIAPPASLIGIPSAVTWFAAEAAIVHRFTVSQGGTYRYANFRLDTSSGNCEAAVLRVDSAGNFSKVMTSGVIPTPTAGDKVIDLGSTYLEPGRYAIGLWFDNTTAQVRMGGSTGLTASRLSAVLGPSLPGGFPTSGVLSWGSTQYLGGLTLS